MCVASDQNRGHLVTVTGSVNGPCGHDGGAYVAGDVVLDQSCNPGKKTRRGRRWMRLCHRGADVKRQAVAAGNNCSGRPKTAAAAAGSLGARIVAEGIAVDFVLAGTERAPKAVQWDAALQRRSWGGGLARASEWARSVRLVLAVTSLWARREEVGGLENMARRVVLATTAVVAVQRSHSVVRMLAGVAGVRLDMRMRAGAM